MSVVVTYPIDVVKLEQLADDGWTTLTLWVANSPDSAFVDTGMVSTPSTIAAALASETYEFTFAYGSGNAAQYFKVVPYDGSNYAPLSASAMFHAGGGTTLARIRQLVGKKLHDMVVATTTSAGNTTTANASTIEVTRFEDDHFQNWYWHNTDNGEWSQVSDFAKTGGVLTLSPAVTSIGSGTNFELTRKWTPSEYRDAINWAIATSYPLLSRTIITTALRTQSSASSEDQFFYRLPNDIRSLNRVEIESSPMAASGNERGYPWREIAFVPRVENLTLGFELRQALPDDRRLRITGLGLHQMLYNDDDYVELIHPEVDLVVYLAAHHLYTLLPNDAASSDIDRYKEQASYYLSLHAGHRDAFPRGRPSKSIWGHDAQWNKGGI